MAKLLIALILLIAGASTGWIMRPFIDRARDYAEAERLQQSISVQGQDQHELASQAMKHADKLVLRAENDDPVVIVNQGFQLRLRAERTFPSIEPIGTR